MRSIKKDTLTAGVLIVLAGVVLQGVKGLPITQKGAKFGPGSFPFVIGIGLALLATLLLSKSFYLSARNGAEAPKERSASQTRALAILLVTAGYFGLISVIGFLISTIIFIFVAVRIFGERRYSVNILYAVAFTVPIYYLFTTWLKMVLPVWGRLGF